MPYAALRPDLPSLVNPTAADLATFARANTPRGLVVLDYRLDTLAPIAACGGLEVLKIQGAAKVTDLSPLTALRSLRELVISTPPGWDGSGRVIEVASYAPLASIAPLERLILLAVRPRDLDLSPIASMHQLREVDISGVPELTIEQYAKLAAALPNTEGRCLKPYFSIPGVGFCRKCKGRQVLLTGAPPRARKWLCPSCQQKQLKAHVDRWNAAAGDTDRIGD